MATTKMIPIAVIHNKFDVRKALNEDRVMQLAELYVSGTPLPPITVIPLEVIDGVQHYAFVDGRHRCAAQAYLERTEVESVVKSSSMLGNQPMLYAEALRANWGGALHPSRADVEHSIIRMIESGSKDKDIRQLLSFFPASALRQYLINAHSTIRKRSISKGLEEVAAGATVPEAAKKFDIDPEVLKDAVSGKRRKLSKNEGTVFGELKRYIGVKLKGANTGIAQKVEHLLRAVEEGEVRVSVAEKVIDVWEKHLNGTIHRVRDWRERLDQMEDKPPK